jgi:hypothetical protein
MWRTPLPQPHRLAPHTTRGEHTFNTPVFVLEEQAEQEATRCTLYPLTRCTLCIPRQTSEERKTLQPQ